MTLLRRRPIAETTARLTVRNGTGAPLLLVYEPWCWTEDLRPEAGRICEATSPRPGWLEVEYTSGAVTVYAWDACVAQVLDMDGKVVVTLDTRVPDFIALAEKDHGGRP